MLTGSSGNTEKLATGLRRRNVLRTAGLGTLAAGVLATSVSGQSTRAEAATITDVDILNFALNLEYLEAEFYSRAISGYGLWYEETTGAGGPGGVVGGSQVPWKSGAIFQMANEIFEDEVNHVLYLRSALGAQAVGEPQIDLVNSFNMLAQAAGLGSGFDPFASEQNFILGGYIFEDVGVTAYAGAAALITSSAYLTSAASILAVEAYHAGELRVLAIQQGLAEQTNQISALRAELSQAADDQGVYFQDVINIVPTDSNSLAYTRTTRQVLNIVYGGINATSGLFFPAGMNGTIR